MALKQMLMVWVMRYFNQIRTNNKPLQNKAQQTRKHISWDILYKKWLQDQSTWGFNRHKLDAIPSWYTSQGIKWMPNATCAWPYLLYWVATPIITRESTPFKTEYYIICARHFFRFERYLKSHSSDWTDYKSKVSQHITRYQDHVSRD